jgi:hypothetical protein
VERKTATPHNEAGPRRVSSVRRPATAAEAVLTLQTSAGNQAVMRALSTRTLARCSGRCTCGGACGQEELLEDGLKGR